MDVNAYSKIYEYLDHVTMVMAGEKGFEPKAPGAAQIFGMYN